MIYNFFSDMTEGQRNLGRLGQVEAVVTKTWNDLKPPETFYNHLIKNLQPPTTTSKISKTTCNHLKNIYNHSQRIEYHLKQAIIV